MLMVRDIRSNVDEFGSVLTMYGVAVEAVVARYGLEAACRVRAEGWRRLPSPRGPARRCRGGGG
jgi:hypothetical protein